MNTQRLLVTGGSGFLGAALTRRLVQDGHSVRVLDNHSRGAMRRLADVKDEIEVREGDIRDAAFVSDCLKGMDGVFHLAYINGTKFFYSKPEQVLDIAVKGMINVLDGCRTHNVGTVLYASSSEVYQTPPAVPTDEKAPLSVPDPLNPRYSYGGGKILGELMALNYGRTGFERMVVFRPHNVYGPDMGWEHVVPEFSLRLHALKKKSSGDGVQPFPIQGSGRETRAFCHVDDFTDGLMRLFKTGAHREIYHIGVDQETSIDTLAMEMSKISGINITIQPGKIAAGATNRRCPDIKKLRSLGFVPKISLEQGLIDTMGWYAANAHLAEDTNQPR
ncbi:MAG: NAD-dependent epimerase/dehydratase family protein [Magnetococcales bacterium]|nr:NAD-dependent epimerase/dehydratase family protein [Magnetococcales bacterium]